MKYITSSRLRWAVGITLAIVSFCVGYAIGHVIGDDPEELDLH